MFSIYSYSIPTDVRDCDRKPITNVPKEKRAEITFPQRQGHHTIHRVSLGEHDHDASQSYSILARYGTRMRKFSKCIMR